nr:MAG TPA: hypothetical protein [Caudoviricetes sp.]
MSAVPALYPLSVEFFCASIAKVSDLIYLSKI